MYALTVTFFAEDGEDTHTIWFDTENEAEDFAGVIQRNSKVEVSVSPHY